jgi:hypothetical protein
MSSVYTGPFTPETVLAARNKLLAVAGENGHVVIRETITERNVTLSMEYAEVTTYKRATTLVLTVNVTNRIGALYGQENIKEHWIQDHTETAHCCLSRVVFTSTLDDRCKSLANLLEFARTHRESV